ncbi:hypothetical protein T484DRAFT_1852166, partial [Baffinella frigidus]
RWVGWKITQWRRKMKEFKTYEANARFYLRQKYVADHIAARELEVLERYSGLEKDMRDIRQEMEEQEHTAEADYKKRADAVRKYILSKGKLGPWVPQTGAVSGRMHFFNADTGEVLAEHPWQSTIEAQWATLRGEVEARQRPLRNSMLAHLERVKSAYEEDVYESWSRCHG